MAQFKRTFSILLRWLQVCHFCYFHSMCAQLAQANEQLEQRTPHASGHVCVMNEDCDSKCCVYANAVSGTCLPKAPIGQVCGFVLGAGTTLQDHYRICEDCDSSCCCGGGCCPTSYCVAASGLHPSVCTKCTTGCCCTEETCCPVPYCAASPDLRVIQGEPCNRCQSGCCCGESECCLSSFCKGSTVGQFCQTCGSGCCCGKLCCAVSFCDTTSLSLTRLVALYGAAPPLPARMPYDAMALAFPKPVDIKEAINGEGPSAVYLPAVYPSGNSENQKTPARPCLQCTTGCCCQFGCCNNVYCQLANLLGQ